MEININDITRKNNNPIVQDIQEFLKTGKMPETLKKKIDELPPYEVRLQQKINKLLMSNKESKLKKLLDYSNLGERFFDKTFGTYKVNSNNLKALE